MKTKPHTTNRVNVITLGCSKNTFDSEILMAQLEASHFLVEHDSAKPGASVVIINTCGFIESAREESINTILQFAQARKRGTLGKLYVTGCLSQRYRNELEKEIPEVDAWFGTGSLPELLKSLKADFRKELLGERKLTTPQHYAWLKISEGCDRPCAFCAIPLMRGKHVSTPMENLVDQVRRLAAKGTRELLLIAQDTTYYGLDIYNKRKLAELLERLSDVDGIEWIRLHYAFPSGFPLEVAKVMAGNKKICKYLDIPLQHISNPMLSAMRRGITTEKINELLYTLRDKIPGVALRTTLISGFPGETQAMHDELLQWAEAMKFERLGVFAYSHEENTAAYSLNDDVPPAIKQQRVAEIMEMQMGVSESLNRRWLGQQTTVIVDRREGNNYVARTQFDSPEVDNEVILSSTVDIKPGSFVKAQIIGARAYDLLASQVY